MEDRIEERALDEMFGVLLKMPEDKKGNRAEIVEALYEAGYRKFEIIDGAEAPYDGGPAFGELKQCGDRAIKQGGISVRDYFAAAALHGICANEAADNMVSPNVLMATGVYLIADAVLQERAK